MDEQINNSSEEVTNEEENEESGFSDFMDIVETVIASVFLVLLIFTFVMRPVTVDGQSMIPTLNDGDKLVMMMCGYSPKRGDIVIIQNDESHVYANKRDGRIIDGDGLKKRLIKRVIATEGQTIDIDTQAHTVTVDGEQLYESYVRNEPLVFDPGAFEYPIEVPEGYIFVMGDNRNNSTDSRSPLVGFVKKDQVVGKASMRFYPFDNFGSLE